MTTSMATDFATTGYPTTAPEQAVTQADKRDPQLRPLPIWFFAFEGVLSGAYDLSKADSALLPVVVGVALVNALISLTVLRKRLKLVKTMLKNSRTRSIAIALIALRFGVHLALGLLGTAVSGATGHTLLAVLMAVCTVTLLWYDQRVSFRVLGLSTER
jgi:hypothetical protein